MTTADAKGQGGEQIVSFSQHGMAEVDSGAPLSVGALAVRVLAISRAVAR